MTMKVRKKILKAANKTPKSDKLKRQLRAEAAKYTKSTLPSSLKGYKKWAKKDVKETSVVSEEVVAESATKSEDNVEA